MSTNDLKFKKDIKTLVVGASSGIGQVFINEFRGSCNFLGCHYSSGEKFTDSDLIGIKKKITNADDCHQLVDEYCDRAGGIDALVILIGGISNYAHWLELAEEDWNNDIFLNLSAPFFLAQRALQNMKKYSNDGGSIVFFSTESAIHGGGAKSLGYGVAKRGIECLVQGVAREAAKSNITVNAIRPGFIESGFHERWQGANQNSIKERINLIPLKRGGTPEEVSFLIRYLISSQARYITGQVLPITGGDWL